MACPGCWIEELIVIRHPKQIASSLCRCLLTLRARMHMPMMKTNSLTKPNDELHELYNTAFRSIRREGIECYQNRLL